MRILLVAIPNHHFFQWVNQLKDSGHEVFWFDITDGGPKSSKINWVTQIKGWKLKWDFPFRFAIKKRLPKLYDFIQKYNENKVTSVFNKAINNIQPDIVHCFEMLLSGLPILSVMEQNKIPFMYSSWGSDLFYFEKMGISKSKVEQFFNRTNYLITDCKRDHTIAVKNGFNAEYLGVFPGNAGLSINTDAIKPVADRAIILIKGYDDGVGKASVVLDALEMVSNEALKGKEIVIYSADDTVKHQIETSTFFSKLKVTVYSRYSFLQNEKLLDIMGKSCIHIANSISDGMPNALLEAMGMGAFPIQSNPGKVTEEVIVHNQNGFLIENPLDKSNIATLIEDAILNETLRISAQDYNTNFIKQNYNRDVLQPKIVNLYETIKSTN